MKIAFYMTTILEYYGGMEKRMIDVSSELARRYPDLEICIVTRNNEFTEKLSKFLAFLGRYKFDRTSIYKESYKKITQKLGKVQYIKTNSFWETRDILKKCNVVYSKNEVLETIIFKYLIWYKNIKYLIFGCHTALYYPYWEQLHNLLYTTWIYKFLTSGVNIFHVLNSKDRQIIQNLWRKSIQIFNPINQHISSKEKDIPISISGKDYNIAWIWRLTKQKWIWRLKKIIDFLARKNLSNNVVVHILWDGERRSEIEKITEKYSFVRYYGFLNNSMIESFLSKMDLLIHTSLRESYWLTVIEANIQDVPVLAFNIPWPKDLIKNGKNGILVSGLEEYCKELEKFVKWENSIKSSKLFISKLLDNEKIYWEYYELLTKER